MKTTGTTAKRPPTLFVCGRNVYRDRREARGQLGGARADTGREVDLGETVQSLWGLTSIVWSHSAKDKVHGF